MLAAARIAAAAREVRQRVRALEPEVVIAWNMRAVLAAAVALAGIRERPRLVFQHNDLLPGPAVARAVRLAARKADLVVALSKAIADDLALPATVVHPGVDLDRFTPAPLPERPRVLVLGAIGDWPRPDSALEAVAVAARELPDLRVTFAGAPIDAAGEKLLASLRARAALPDLDGRVSFAGSVTDSAAALADATSLLHAADREPFGLALVEALARGRPVVAPAAAGPLEIVDETCGRLYEPGDAHAAATALVEAVRDAPRLGAAARERAERHFDLTAARERWRAATSVD